MSDRIIHVTDANFADEVLEADRPVLVDFWAEWCGPCHMIAPAVEAIADERSDSLRVAKLNVDDNPYTAQHYGVQSIPTLILFQDGRERSRLIGARAEESILQALNLDTAA
jgi:thioredoxin 1